MVNKILVAVSSFGKYDRKPLDILKKEGLEILSNPYGRRLNEKEIINMGKDCVGILAGLEFYNKDVLKALPNLKVISRVGSGISNIDLKTAQEELGINVFNTPFAPVQAVAELAVGLMLSLLRNTYHMHSLMKKGEWKRLDGNLATGKTIGIIGYGRIGRRVAGLLKVFDVSIIACDKPDIARVMFNNRVKEVSLNELLKQSDVVMLHLSGECCIIGKRQINLMKKTAYIVNLARGGAIDEKALYEALKNKRIAGAALDVFCKEPYRGPLTKLDNVILTPHIGSYAKESRIAMEIEASHNLIKGLKMKGGIFERYNQTYA